MNKPFSYTHNFFSSKDLQNWTVCISRSIEMHFLDFPNILQPWRWKLVQTYGYVCMCVAGFVCVW